MDMSTAQSWLALALSVIAVGTAIWNFIQSPSKRNSNELSTFKSEINGQVLDLDRTVNKLDRDYEVLKSAISQLPDKETVHRLELSMADMAGTMKAMAVSLEATSNTTKRMETFLFERGTEK